MKKLLLLSLFSTALLATTCFYACQFSSHPSEKPPSEAGAAFLHWDAARMFPDGQFHTENYTKACEAMHLAAQLRGDRSQTWEDLGPKNIGGRTLCLAINPLDTNILWMGSASGGIWKSTSGGRGVNAWQRVETGFPVLGVSALAIEPGNPNVLYAGTGEVYNVENTQPNVAIRTTRGTYGIGILKSTDGGTTWFKSLDWGYGKLRGVQDIKINPLRPETVFAATSEGLLRSWDAGASWHAVHAQKMAVDIEINPVDTNHVYVTFGSLEDDSTSGIYHSTNGGSSFSEMTNGLPNGYSGKALLTLSPSQPQILYASIGNLTNQNGLYKTTNAGNSWTLVSSEDVSKYQGWYAHDVAVQPNNPNNIVWVGIDAWKSTNSGATVAQKTYWYLWNFGYVPAGGPEGPPDYVHADIHRAYFAPNDPNKVYLVSDGGLFVSSNGGETYEGRNGGYQTQQFYANIGHSTTNGNVCIGGMQDNATAIYAGNPSWVRVIGGDGECAAIRPGNELVMYGSSQYLNMAKSTNGGANWYGIGNEITEDAAFNGPFELAPSNPDILYAGAQSIWRSDNAGDNWYNISNGAIADNDVVLTIAINPHNPDELFCSTAPTTTNQARVYKFSASNGITQQLDGLPNRYCMDIAYSVVDDNLVYAVFGGFNTPHLFKTTNSGISWTAIDNGIPDVPANTLVVDPLLPNNLYLGNDLGVWFSSNGGDSWSLYSSDAPKAMLVMHLGISANRKLRVATHGLGMWQTDLAEASSTHDPALTFTVETIKPNPATDNAVLHFTLKSETTTTIDILDMAGRRLRSSAPERLPEGLYTRTLPISGLLPGTYGVVLRTKKGKKGSLLVIQ
jgi:hypothetical protein